jgi:L-alanine-DL-glutamate epimerase-like enolase superfamily enzyme
LTSTEVRSLRIAALETRRYSFRLDPPFRAAWDPVPRERVEATLAIVRADDGTEGYASGDALPDAAVLEPLLVGVDPFRTEVVHEHCEAVDFHGSRPWIAEVAVWDLVGRALGEPLWRLLGGRQDCLFAYASTGELVESEERVRRAVELRDHGVRALKVRFHLDDWRRDVEVVERLRDAVGSDLEIMVDMNQGWRMPGDLRPRFDVATAAQCARALEPFGVYWLEEPLYVADVDGYARLRSLTSLRLAAGEMVRTAAEARDLVVRGGVDVIQADVVLAGGIVGCRRIAALAELHGRAWSPHTWTNGLGLVANLHLACAVSTAPFVEVPYDPPAWSPKRRDWLLPAPVEIAPDGTIRPPEGPGLGPPPDLDALEDYRVA